MLISKSGNRNCRQAGFTLIELIAVLIVLGIVTALGSSFLVTSVDSYRQMQVKHRLVGKGRLALEQMTRYLRSSVPGSVRVSASGDCIEFLPTVGGGNYIGELADDSNGAAPTTSISTAPIGTDLGSAIYVVVGALNASEIYTLAQPSARANVGSLGAQPYTAIPLQSGHRFVRNSNYKRLYLADNPRRFCISGTNLVAYEAYGLGTASLNDSNPGGASLLLANSVAPQGNAFSLSGGSEDRNAVISVSLTFSEASVSIDLNQKILVRNVP